MREIISCGRPLIASFELGPKPSASFAYSYPIPVKSPGICRQIYCFCRNSEQICTRVYPWRMCGYSVHESSSWNRRCGVVTGMNLKWKLYFHKFQLAMWKNCQRHANERLNAVLVTFQELFPHPSPCQFANIIDKTCHLLFNSASGTQRTSVPLLFADRRILSKRNDVI